MKVKLDENLGRMVLEVFLAAGHDAVSISQQALTGAPDARVFDVCRSERRVLVTLDHDFGNLIRFPIEKSAGTMILEPTRNVSHSVLVDLAREACQELTRRPIEGRLWIVQPGRIRERIPPDRE